MNEMLEHMRIDEIIEFLDDLEEVLTLRPAPGDGSPEISWGDTFFYYTPDGEVPKASPPPGPLALPAACRIEIALICRTVLALFSGNTLDCAKEPLVATGMRASAPGFSPVVKARAGGRSRPSVL